AAHREHQRQRQAFPERRHHEHIPCLEEISEIPARAEKPYSRRDTFQFGLSLERLAKMTVADDDQMDVCKRRIRERLEEVPMSLLRGQASDHTYDLGID